MGKGAFIGDTSSEEDEMEGEPSSSEDNEY